ncbi:nitrate reductase [Telmatospirillum siberiense]|nr:nitrate reductase [Telmatospirillum siberiense]
MADAIRTTCPYCGVGCGVLATPAADGLTVAGDPTHPANFGRLCVKGAALGETVGLEGRLLHPILHGRRVDWNTALDRLADEFSQAIARHGADSVAFYVSGQLLTEDYYVANKLMKGFIGSANIDTNSRLCMSSSVAGHQRAFGADTVPGCYADLDEADLVVLVGSNAAWCHPVLFQRLQAARAQRPEMRLVVIDPRRTATAEAADLHLALKPGSDVALFNGLLRHLSAAGCADHDFLSAHCAGSVEALAEAGLEPGPPAEACDLDPGDLVRFYDWFAATEKTVTVFSQGVNQSSAGTDKVNAIINCHLLTGRIGRPGMGPLSFTGQPNAMGGREVGGLANQLAAHMGFDETSRDRVGRFWRAPAMALRPGLKAVDLFRAVEQGRIKALWIMATNPAVSLPDANLVRQALDHCAFVAVSDCMADTDTTRRAHLLLPALTWAEKDGTVTNSERRISRQRPVLPVPGEARPDWWMICRLAERLGFREAFAYGGPSDIFAEHARLSAFENDGARDFDIGALAGIDYDLLAPVQWPVRADASGTGRLFGQGGFFHGDGRARLVAVRNRPPASELSPARPLALNTGRTRDQWHTMTRTGKAPRLAAHAPEPWLAMHPADAARLDIDDGATVRVESDYGRALLRVTLDSTQRAGEVFAPMHWNDQFAGQAVIGKLLASNTDPLSGQPELKFGAVRVDPVPLAWEAVLLSRRPVTDWPADIIWSRAAGEGHHIHRLAGVKRIENWAAWCLRHLGEGVWLDYQDRRIGLYRAAKIDDERLDALLFVAAPGRRPDPASLSALFTGPAPRRRIELLAGGGIAGDDRGPIICACHQIGRKTILDAITGQGLGSIADIGTALRAGTNCGSCVPELQNLLGLARP